MSAVRKLDMPNFILVMFQDVTGTARNQLIASSAVLEKVGPALSVIVASARLHLVLEGLGQKRLEPGRWDHT